MRIATRTGRSGATSAYQATASYLGQLQHRTFPTRAEAEKFVTAVKEAEARERWSARNEAMMAAMADAASAPLTTLKLASVLDWDAPTREDVGSRIDARLEKLIADVRVFELNREWERDFCERSFRSARRAPSARIRMKTAANLASIRIAVARKADHLGVALPSMAFAFDSETAILSRARVFVEAYAQLRERVRASQPGSGERGNALAHMEALLERGELEIAGLAGGATVVAGCASQHRRPPPPRL